MICEVTPGFAVENIVMELLQCDAVEGVTTGLRSLMEILLFGAQRHYATSSDTSGRPRPLLATLEQHELEPKARVSDIYGFAVLILIVALLAVHWMP